jgi:DNA polymerase-1
MDATPYPSDTPPDGTSKEEWQKEKATHVIHYFATRVLNKDAQSLASVFLFGVDPHLATALTMLRFRGEIEFIGTATEYLASLSGEEQEKLKSKYKDARQQAKAVNFGLLYGMMPDTLHRYGVTSYGLTWKLDDAKAYYAMWFELYPEIGFLHCFIRFMRSTKLQPEEVKIWDKFRRVVKSKPYPVKRYKTRSLAGRPFDVLDHQNAAFSYGGQGSGADLTVRAIAKLPDDMVGYLTLVVHDEIVLIAPEEKAAAALATLERTMNEAANQLLGGYCQSVTEGKVHDRWAK